MNTTNTTSTCINCDEPIDFYRVVGNSGYWVHPDRVDLGCSGSSCDNDDTDAEPSQTTFDLDELLDRVATLARTLQARSTK